MLAYDLAVDRLTHVTSIIAKRADHLSLDWLFIQLEEISPLLPDFVLILKQRKFFSDPTDYVPSSEYLFLHRLSFQICDHRIKRFQSPLLLYQLAESNSAAIFVEAENLLVIGPKNQLEPNKKLLFAVAEAFLSYFQNYAFDRLLRSASNRFTSTYNRLSLGNPDLSLFVRHLRQEYGVGCAIFVEQPSSFTITAEPFPYIEDPQIRIPFGTKSYFDEAIATKSASGGAVVVDGTIVHFVYLPLTLSDENREGHRCLYIETTDKPLPEYVVRFADSGLRYLQDRALIKTHSSIIENLHVVKVRAEFEIRSGNIQSFADRLAFLREHLNEICWQLKAISRAHSVTIRIYDPFADRLRLFSWAEDTQGSYIKDASADISVTQEQYTSLNAFVFLNCTPATPVYLTDIATERLPENLKAAGFKGPKNIRANSKSEFCMTIWNSVLPIGTMNLESPNKHGFTGDEPFFIAVSRIVGDIFAAIDQTTAPKNLAQPLRIYELAHAIASDNSDVDIGSLPDDVRDIFKQWREFVSNMRKDTTGYGQAESVTSAQLQRDLEDIIGPTSQAEHSLVNLRLDARPIERFNAETLKVIVRLIVSNARAHSRLSNDILDIRLDAGPNIIRPVFSIYYKSLCTEVETSTLANFGYAPIRNADGTMRFGSFLLGSLVRSLGGMLYVMTPSEQLDQMPLEFMIRLRI
jgi:hypothetical protein